MKTVIIISAMAEWQAVKELLSPAEVEATPLGETFFWPLDPKTRFFHGGWGKISAAATAQHVLDRYRPDLLVNLGTCGGFAGRIETGTIILVDRTIVYDILEQMGDANQAIAHYATKMELGWLPEPLPYPVLRGLLISADRDILPEDIPVLVEKYGAAAADWESGAIAWVAQQNAVACLILRGVTDLVDPQGGEAYGDLALFHSRTREVMQTLLGQLPGWLSVSTG
ncbi:MAG: 5'-methylthioadenosine/S-adenosylhomocysteine nucleosidase [Anaerolineales bacterium]|nr:5'-methylthioadenosine/S-adenosylhomocysteine nucleosidase [Anaerolineales bacterium]